MDIIEVINKRKSVRKYSQAPLSQELLSEIKSIASSVERLYPDIDMKIHIVEDGQKMQAIMPGIIGAYGKVKAPHYIAVTSEEKPGYRENVGYTIENLVLRLTSMGLGTCWIGGSVKEGLFNRILEMPSNHKPMIVIALGCAEREEELYRKTPQDAKRKAVSEFVTGEMDEALGKVMEAVRLSPSAVNIQPWRFFIEGSRVRLYTAKAPGLLGNHLEEMRKIDAGICLSHLKLAGEHYDKKVEIKRENAPEIRKHVYVATAYVE